MGTFTDDILIPGTSTVPVTLAPPCEPGYRILMKTFLMYLLTAIAGIVGCYLPWSWSLVPAALNPGLFAWLLTLHEAAAGLAVA